MKKVLAIMGSPRKLGNTYHVTKLVEERMQTLGDVQFDYIFLRDLDLGICRGCRLCMNKGEEFCPLKDDREMLEGKILDADGVIFASPTYLGNVSGLMKITLDRFAYVSHRPHFFKNAMALTTSGGGGMTFMLLALSIPLNTWGFKIAHKFGVVMHENPNWGTPKERESLEREKIKKVDKAAKRFHDSLNTDDLNPSLFNMAQFLYIKKARLKEDPDSLDYHYWKSQGWFEKDTYYFYDPKANILKKWAALLASKFFGLLAR
jgi:multimeric flavodoxin WrbA